MRIRTGFLAGLISIVLPLLAVAPAQATPITLTSGESIDYSNGLDVIIGDKEFVFQSCTVAATAPSIPSTSGTCSSSSFTITADIVGNGPSELIGFIFNGTTDVGVGGALDIGLIYTVTVVNSSQEITDAHLLFNGGNSPYVSVDETISTNPGLVFECGIDQNGTAPNGSCNLPDPTNSIHVSKDISLAGFQTSGDISISDVEQLFSQSAVPEPASLSVLGMGLLGLGWFVRRKRAKA